VITEQPKSGWSVASNNGESVALDLNLTQVLINAGHVREVIRALQEGRKSAGFDISDRIIVSWNATAEVAPAVKEALEHIKREVLAVEMSLDQSLLCDTELGFTFNLKKS
jgi:isoleucyl-tRNA synthetase